MTKKKSSGQKARSKARAKAAAGAGAGAGATAPEVPTLRDSVVWVDEKECQEDWEVVDVLSSAHRANMLGERNQGQNELVDEFRRLAMAKELDWVSQNSSLERAALHDVAQTSREPRLRAPLTPAQSKLTTLSGVCSRTTARSCQAPAAKFSWKRRG